MTTEILRNIMYRQADNEQNPEREDRLATVGLVVLDEVPVLLLVALQESSLVTYACPAHDVSHVCRVPNASQCGTSGGQVQCS